jgi:hypothetical protein
MWGLIGAAEFANGGYVQKTDFAKMLVRTVQQSLDSHKKLWSFASKAIAETAGYPRPLEKRIRQQL